jgi:hypothetical protein
MVSHKEHPHPCLEILIASAIPNHHSPLPGLFLPSALLPLRVLLLLSGHSTAFGARAPPSPKPPRSSISQVPALYALCSLLLQLSHLWALIPVFLLPTPCLPQRRPPQTLLNATRGRLQFCQHSGGCHNCCLQERREQPPLPGSAISAEHPDINLLLLGSLEPGSPSARLPGALSLYGPWVGHGSGPQAPRHQGANPAGGSLMTFPNGNYTPGPTLNNHVFSLSMCLN